MSNAYLNPYGFAIKQHLAHLLGNNYGKHAEVVDKITHYFVTQRDFTEFMGMIGDLYQVASHKTFEEMKKKLNNNDLP